MEIERKFTIERLPEELERFPRKHLEQAYLCTAPVVRVRRSDDAFFLTCKGAGLLAREEYELPLTEEAYRHLLPKADGLSRTAIASPLPGTPLSWTSSPRPWRRW